MFKKKNNFDLKYHFVLCTGYRHPILKNRIMYRCQEIIEDLLTNHFDCKIIEMNIQPDHIHIMFETTPSIQLSKMICSVKTVTSRMLKKEFSKELSKYYWTSKFWNANYFICTVSDRSEELVQKYIRNQ